MKANNRLMDILARNVLIVTLIFGVMAPAWALSGSSKRVVGLEFPGIEKDIMERLFENYDSKIKPTPKNSSSPTMANVDLMLRRMDEVSDLNMDFTVQIILRMRWEDSRLRYDSMRGQIHYLTTLPYMVWIPDLFFKNEKRSYFHHMVSANSFLRIFPDGGLLYSVRITLSLSCPMNLELFPLDRQECHIMMGSYGYTTDDLVFLWKRMAPIQLTKKLHLPKFTLEKFITDYCNSKTTTGEYSCLKIKLIFKREFGYYLIQYYIPSCMLVIISWISFWLDEKAVLARVFVVITTLSTMTMQTSNIANTLPQISYTKAIDVWMGTCIAFMFAALLELVLVNTVSDRKAIEERKARKKQWDLDRDASLQADVTERNADDGRPVVVLKGKHSHQTEGSSGFEKVRPTEVRRTRVRRMSQMLLEKYTTRGQRIDFASRLLFPVLFIIFNIMYWATYLQSNEE